ncbi:MAG: Rieske 2Fe-2S domain-containing protein [Methylococcaceae bacterium]|nr:Rieske 2Fe-2S domain-containing protein [Methylococcaceae bacterium]
MPKPPKPICTRAELEAIQYLAMPIQYKNQADTAVVFIFDGHAYAYINRCMHMQKPLNCEQDAIFDDSLKFLRCSMHGFVFDPTTGTCLSPVCYGQKLQALRISEMDGAVYFTDKHVD